ncbi:hypothetical protein D8674_000524 [Pyrus ussuriensis x Pyrus communis]|uniref:Uncharacterized protein n=1 Tax=Pyrus ussuriensis x Pyrus communis TaxID=2448454 RepID=A0A5N5FGU7_9ROSA|nr:hypothetical protein D8674_000524 [Pyrus ussuriensis x Pyrus communis]
MKKKIKFSNNGNNNVNVNLKKGKNKSKDAKDLPTPVELPEEFKNEILGRMNGTKLQLFMQKSLKEIDIKGDQGRLSLP